MKVAISIIFLFLVCSLFVMMLNGGDFGEGYIDFRSSNQVTGTDNEYFWELSTGKKICTVDGEFCGVDEWMSDGELQYRQVAMDNYNLPLVIHWVWMCERNPFYGQNRGIFSINEFLTTVYLIPCETAEEYLDWTGSGDVVGDGATSDSGNWVVSFVFGTQYGWLALLTAIGMASAVVGLHIFGSGIGDVSVGAMLLTGVALGVFYVVSAPVYDYITVIPVFGVVLYFGITAVYAMDVINTLVS